ARHIRQWRNIAICSVSNRADRSGCPPRAPKGSHWHGDQVWSRIDLGDIMSISKRNDALENSIRDAATQNAANLRVVRGGEGEIVADNLGQMIGRLSGSSIAEIDRLVSDLRAVRQHLENERDRVQRAITEFAYLS